MDPEPGEEVFFHGHPSWRSMLMFYAKGLVLVIIAGVLAGLITAVSSKTVKVGWVAVVVGVALALVLVVGLIRRIRITYTITHQRLTIDIGLLSREVHETRLERVQNVNSTQTVLQRMLRIGVVDFDTAAGADYDFKFVGVAHPHQIVRTVDRALRALQQKTPGV
jgi:uncharacterized membrane protein YdbT with pleckstrin-like domain